VHFPTQTAYYDTGIVPVLYRCTVPGYRHTAHYDLCIGHGMIASQERKINEDAADEKRFSCRSALLTAQ